ncbi:MAG: SDR family oxidoreductase [Actinobacteria bacterium]|nr:SDR family oxidoreductase [Actinomycetota bacterium]
MSAGSRVAVVSGAASGIGAATVAELLDAGFAVVGVDLAETAPGFDGGEVRWVSGDVTDPETWAEAERTGRELDPDGAAAFVACAADISVAPFLETSISEWRRLFEVNVIGVINGMRALVPAMVARGDGAVAVCCSVNSLFVEREIAAYSASKAALLSVTRTLAVEHAGDGIRINAVCPGVVDTPLLRRHVETMPDPAAAEKAMNDRVPTGAVTRPEEVGRLLRFLVSADASGLSGSAVMVDGGLTTTYEF